MQSTAQMGGLCVQCNYPLRDLSENRCPECGRTFDPSDRTTVNLGRATGPPARAIMSDSAWPVVALLVVPGTFFLWRAAHPAFYYMEWLVWALLVLPFLASLVLIRTAAREVLCTWYEQPPPRSRWRDLRNAAVAAMTLALAWYYEVPVRAHFWLVRSNLEQVKAALDAGVPPTSLIGRRVGLFHIDHILGAQRGWMISFTGNGDGFAYVTGGRSSLFYNSGVDGHITDNWYWYASD